jgi:hypothetical protein
MCSGNHLTELPPLPDTLQYLDCNTNDIRILPDLPEGLIILGCEKNPLETLPELPHQLSHITCELPVYNEPINETHMTSERVQCINKQIVDWMEMLAQHSRDRCEIRCALYKEEIMMKVWHPSRVEKLLEMGYDVEDM